MTTVTLPTIQQPFVDEERRINYLWLDKLKFIERLQPLSDIDNTSLESSIAATYSTITRSINAQTGTTYTFVLTDAGKLVTLSNGSAITATVPPNSSVAFPVGTQIDLAALGAGQVTLAQGTGVTVSSEDSKKKLTKQYSGATLVKTATDVWLLVGSIAT